MNALDKAIYDKLNVTGVTSLLASATSIYSVQAKNNATLPYIVYNIQGGGDENLDPHRTKNIVISVRCYSDNSKYTAGVIDAAVDTALHLQTLNVSGWSNFWLAREEDIETIENLPNDEKVWMVGGLYRVRIEDT